MKLTEEDFIETTVGLRLAYFLSQWEVALEGWRKVATDPRVVGQSAPRSQEWGSLYIVAHSRGGFSKKACVPWPKYRAESLATQQRVSEERGEVAN